MIKYHLEEFQQGVVINWNEILIGKTPVVRNAMYYLSQKLFFFLLFWAAEKRTYFTFQWNLTLKRGFFILNHNVSPSFDKLLWSPLVHMNLFIAPKTSQKSTIIFFTFVTGVELTSWCLLRLWYMVFFVVIYMVVFVAIFVVVVLIIVIFQSLGLNFFVRNCKFPTV